MICVARSIPGSRCDSTQDPSATLALNVLDDMLCCIKLIWRRPTENACSASTEDAKFHIEIHLMRSRYQESLTRCTAVVHCHSRKAWTCICCLFPPLHIATCSLNCVRGNQRTIQICSNCV